MQQQWLLEVHIRRNTSDSARLSWRKQWPVQSILPLHNSDSLLIEIFQWDLTPASKDSVFFIKPASDTTVGFSQSVNKKEKYLSFGFAEGYVGPSADWRFTKSSDGKYSRYSFLCVCYLTLTLPIASRSILNPMFWIVVITLRTWVKYCCGFRNNSIWLCPLSVRPFPPG